MSIAVCVPTQALAAPRTEAVNDDAKAAMRVIVIDDNQDSASALALLVELWGYDVRVGYDGYSALDLAQGFHPHAVLLDIGLPGFNGYDTACRIRQAETHAQSEPALLVAVTGYGSPQDVARAMQSGFDHHLVKPSDPDVLERFLRNRACYLSTHRHAHDALQCGSPVAAGTAGAEAPMASVKSPNF